MIYSINYISRVIPIFIIILGLAIFHKFFVNNIMRMGGVPKFILSFIFFIPCLLNDILVSFKNDLITAPILTYILIVLEIVVLIVYFLAKKLLVSNTSKTEIILYKDKFFLDTQKEINLGNIEQLRGSDSKDELSNPIINETPVAYALSFWIQINHLEINNVEFPILLYGDDTNPKPRICFSNNIKNGGIININLSGINKFDDSTKLNITIENQKWHHLVLNYNGTIADVFFDGILQKSVNLSGNMPVHSFSDSIKIGSERQSMNGVITDIRYHKFPLSAYQILAKYRFGINTIDL
jgi:hypothetical protein